MSVTPSVASFGVGAVLNLNSPWALGLTLRQSSCLTCGTPGAGFILRSEFFFLVLDGTLSGLVSCLKSPSNIQD